MECPPEPSLIDFRGNYELQTVSVRLEVFIEKSMGTADGLPAHPSISAKGKDKGPKLNCLRAFIFWIGKGLKAFTIYTFRTLDAWGPF
jgi:hypothetical protein